MESAHRESADGEINSLLETVSHALADEAGKSVFALGGKIDLGTIAKALSNASELSPIVVRWDSGEINHCRKVSLPVVQTDADSQGAFAKFLADSEPATYGVGSEAVFDETYRKAGKMNATRFSTNFNPYEHGVVDAIAQALTHGDHRGIRAELYNLNIYSGPSGKFKAHVDTPRSEEQMGSLVVCFPHPYQGGQLAVRHGGREVTFDWASNSASTVQWGAFFSDCEHEVLEVTGGHRLTLAYNLYWTTFEPTSMADGLSILEPESLRFFGAIRKLLQCPDFLPGGGLLGFTCTHSYPHTSSASANTLQHTLKGLDMLVYQALKRLTGSVKVTHALDDHLYWEDLAEDSEKEDEGGTASTSPTQVTQPSYARLATIGTSIWRPITVDGCGDYYANPEELSYDRWGVGGDDKAFTRDHVTWLNHHPRKTSPRELAVAFLVYGNEPGMQVYYSSAVIIADFRKPSASDVSEDDERSETPKAPE